MAKVKVDKEAEDAPPKKLAVLDEILKGNKDHHYAFETVKDYCVSSGSLTFDIELGGGIHPGVFRSSGISSGGKSSLALAFARNFQILHPEKGVVIYFKAEGRLSETMIARSGVSTNPDQWQVIPTNDYEFVIDTMRRLVKDNPNGNFYYFILDSLDALVPRNDLAKSATEASKTAGGALLSADMLRKMAVAFGSKGHICDMISQVRDVIKIDKYAKVNKSITNSSGGHAISHYSDWVFEFQARYKDDEIMEAGAKVGDSPIGHWCKIVLRKTTNEKDGKLVRYPIKYGRTGGTSVWIEYEVADQLIAWDFAKAKGAWISMTDEIVKELSDAGLTIQKDINGIKALRAFLEENPEVTKFLYKKFYDALKK